MSYSRATNSSMNHSNNLPPEVVMKRDLRKKVLDYHSRRELENLERNAMQNYEHERSDTPMSAAEVGIEAEVWKLKVMETILSTFSLKTRNLCMRTLSYTNNKLTWNKTWLTCAPKTKNFEKMSFAGFVLGKR